MTAGRGFRGLPWLRSTADELPWRLKLRLTFRFLRSYPWQRWQCRGGLATPRARYGARHLYPKLPLECWHDGLAATEFAGLITDAERMVRWGAIAALTAPGTTGTARIRAEELPAEAAARTAHLLGRSTVGIDTCKTLAWWLWLNHGDDALWTRLAEHAQPAETGPLRGLSRLALGLEPETELHAAVIDPAVPARVRARITERLLARGSADDPAEAAYLYAMADLPAERLRVDPDGSLLAARYATMDAEHRRRLRTVLTELGELDLIRSLHRATPSRFAVLADGDHVPDDPSRWFRASLGAPVIDAATVTVRLRDWEPDDPEDRQLLESLRRTEPAALRSARDRLAGFEAHPVELPEDTVGIGRCAFTPDGTRFAVEVSTRSDDHRIVEYSTATRTVLGEVPSPASTRLVTLVHTGSALVTLAGEGPTAQVSVTVGDTVRRLNRVGSEHGAPRQLQPLRDGFGYFRYGSLRSHDAVGDPQPFGMSVAGPIRDIRQLAVAPNRDRFAVLAETALHVCESGPYGWLCRPAAPFNDRRVVFADSDTIISTRNGGDGCPLLKRRSAHDGFATEQAVTRLEVPAFHGHDPHATELYPLSDGTRLLVAMPVERQPSPHGDNLFVVETATLDNMHASAQPGWHVTAASPDTRTFLGTTYFNSEPRLSLRTLAPHPLAALADTPLSELEPTDLAVVARERDRTDPRARPLVDLLYHCLRHRFGADVALADAPLGTDYDIHLGGDQ